MVVEELLFCFVADKSSASSLCLDFTKASSMCQDRQGRCECHSMNLHAEGHFIQYDFQYNLFLLLEA